MICEKYMYVSLQKLDIFMQLGEKCFDPDLGGGEFLWKMNSFTNCDISLLFRKN